MSDLISFHPPQKRAIFFNALFPLTLLFSLHLFILIFKNCQSNRENEVKKMCHLLKNVCTVTIFEWYVDGIQNNTETRCNSLEKVYSLRCETFYHGNNEHRWFCTTRIAVCVKRRFCYKWECNCNPWRISNGNFIWIQWQQPLASTQIPRYRHNLTTIGTHSCRSYCGRIDRPTTNEIQYLFDMCYHRLFRWNSKFT